MAVSNKSAAGGASGAQPAMVDFANKITGGPSFADSFAYANGPLANKGGWTGDAADAFAVENGALKMNAYTWDYDKDYPIHSRQVYIGKRLRNRPDQLQDEDQEGRRNWKLLVYAFL